MSTPELIPYDPALEFQIATAIVEVYSIPPFNDTLSLNDAREQISADSSRPGFGAILVRHEDAIKGFSWWFDISGNELADRWLPRFTPKESVPRPEGNGVFMMEFGLLPELRGHGLGKRLLVATLRQIEPGHDWIALNVNDYAHAGLALLKSAGFYDLGLKGSRIRDRICMMKML